MLGPRIKNAASYNPLRLQRTFASTPFGAFSAFGSGDYECDMQWTDQYDCPCKGGNALR